MSNDEEKMSTKVMEALSSLKKKAEAHDDSGDEVKINLMSIVKKLAQNRSKKTKEE